MQSSNESATLFRAGDPTEGADFWTPDDVYARQAHPEATELHEAVLRAGARVKKYTENITRAVVWAERDAGEYDALDAPALCWNTHEVYVLNPAVLRILK